jgi:hypothetical protein
MIHDPFDHFMHTCKSNITFMHEKLIHLIYQQFFVGPSISHHIDPIILIAKYEM